MTDEDHLRAALQTSLLARTSSSPNPWVGCRIVPTTSRANFEGATSPPGGPHAEIVALRAAGSEAAGSTAYVTLEPCSHQGRTPPCADALIAAGVSRVVIGVLDPDPLVSGRGVARLRKAGVEVRLGVLENEIRRVLAPYLKHREQGRPWVVLKLASSLDDRIAAPDGNSKWITGPEARADVHHLRAESDAILIGAGTVRADNPRLTVRHIEGRSPRRIVLGAIPAGSAVSPADEMHGSLPDVLDSLGLQGVVQLLVEGGAHVAHAFHGAGLVDQYTLYFAPALFGGADALPMFNGPGASSMSDLWRGHISAVVRLGQDLRIDVEPRHDEVPLGNLGAPAPEKCWKDPMAARPITNEEGSVLLPSEPPAGLR